MNTEILSNLIITKVYSVSTLYTLEKTKQKEIRTLRLPALGSDFYCLVRIAGLEPV